MLPWLWVCNLLLRAIWPLPWVRVHQQMRRQPLRLARGRMHPRKTLWHWVRAVQLLQTLLMCHQPQLVQSPTVVGLARLLVAAMWLPVTKFQLVRPVSNVKLNTLHLVPLPIPVLMLLTVASCSMWPKVYKNKLQLLAVMAFTSIMSMEQTLTITTIMMEQQAIKLWQQVLMLKRLALALLRLVALKLQQNLLLVSQIPRVRLQLVIPLMQQVAKQSLLVLAVRKRSRQLPSALMPALVARLLWLLVQLQ